MGMARTLGEAACRLKYANLSKEVVDCAKLHILDGIGVELHGSTLRPLFDPVIRILRDWGGEGPASVFGKSPAFRRAMPPS